MKKLLKVKDLGFITKVANLKNTTELSEIILNSVNKIMKESHKDKFIDLSQVLNLKITQVLFEDDCLCSIHLGDEKNKTIIYYIARISKYSFVQDISSPEYASFLKKNRLIKLPSLESFEDTLESLLPLIQHWWTMRAIEDSSEIDPIEKTDLKSRKSRESFLETRLDDRSLNIGMVLNNCLFSYLLEDEDFSKGIIRDNNGNCVKYLHQKERESTQREKKSKTSFSLKDAVVIPIEPFHRWHGVGPRLINKWKTYLSQYDLRPGMTDSEIKTWITI